MSKPLTDAEVMALANADLSEDAPYLRALAVLERAHEAELIFGGNPYTRLDPSGWTKSTLPAVARLIADEFVPPAVPGLPSSFPVGSVSGSPKLPHAYNVREEE